MKKALFEIDQDLVEKIQNDLTIFHPTINQMKIIYELTNQISELTQLDPALIRTIYIKGIVAHQQSTKTFYYETENFLPQFRLQGSLKTLEFIKAEFIKILKDPNQIDLLMEYNMKAFDLYVEKFAPRKPYEEL